MRFLRNNALSLVLFAAFLAFTSAQIASGFYVYNDERIEHAKAAVEIGAYLHSGHFFEALFENWESEFLQMFAFVLLSARLKQKGSSESKPIDEFAEQDEDPTLHQKDEDAPWPVRKGGVALGVYKNSLSLFFLAMFVLSFALHAVFGCELANEENVEHGKEVMSVFGYLASSQFWFESFQNWQSEFLAVLSIVFGSIYLRQYGSPQSKPVHASNDETGG